MRPLGEKSSRNRRNGEGVLDTARPRTKISPSSRDVLLEASSPAVLLERELDLELQVLTWLLEDLRCGNAGQVGEPDTPLDWLLAGKAPKNGKGGGLDEDWSGLSKAEGRRAITCSAVSMNR